MTTGLHTDGAETPQERDVANAASTEDRVPERRERNPVFRFFTVLGPGLVTGAADDDPSGIATYSQAGATYGMGMLWTVPVTLPLMMAVQEICDRMALATGDSLGLLIRRRFRRGFRIALGLLLAALICANVLNVAADLNAIGRGMELLHAGPGAIWTVIAGLAIAATVLLGSFGMISKIFKWLCLTLLIYVGVLFVSHVHWSDVLAGLVGIQFQPTPAYLDLAVGVLGTSISPYMFFWQSAQRVVDLRAEDRGGDQAPALQERPEREARQRLRNGRIDVFTGMAFSVLIMFAIITSAAATLGAHHNHISSAAEAAKALEPIAGQYAGMLFAIGFIGSGVLGVPVLAASGAAGMAGLLNKTWGLDRPARRAPLFYGILAAGLLLGTLLAVLATDPIGLLVLSAVVNGIAAGPFLIVMMLISRDRHIMGPYRNGTLATIMGWAATVIMCAAGAFGTWYTISGQ